MEKIDANACEHLKNDKSPEERRNIFTPKEQKPPGDNSRGGLLKRFTDLGLAIYFKSLRQTPAPQTESCQAENCEDRSGRLGNRTYTDNVGSGKRRT